MDAIPTINCYDPWTEGNCVFEATLSIEGDCYQAGEDPLDWGQSSYQGGVTETLVLNAAGQRPTDSESWSTVKALYQR